MNAASLATCYRIALHFCERAKDSAKLLKRRELLLPHRNPAHRAPISRAIPRQLPIASESQICQTDWTTWAFLSGLCLACLD
ncbi:MAG: hypothetical protein KGL44_02370 [Sphingomonadales bacterium]|nr:hypothetical protein [Sphingomonadales bacterium]